MRGTCTQPPQYSSGPWTSLPVPACFQESLCKGLRKIWRGAGKCAAERIPLQPAIGRSKYRIRRNMAPLCSPARARANSRPMIVCLHEHSIAAEAAFLVVQWCTYTCSWDLRSDAVQPVTTGPQIIARASPGNIVIQEPGHFLGTRGSTVDGCTEAKAHACAAARRLLNC